MSFGGGGRPGGGGSSTSTTSAEFPPEFRPLAKTAVEQIQELQRALPVAQFAQPQPAQVAGLSPFLLEALRLASLTPATTPAEQALGELTFPIQQTVAQIPRFTEPTAAAQAGLRALSPRLGGGPVELQSLFPTASQDVLAQLVFGSAAAIPTVSGTPTAFGEGMIMPTALPLPVPPADTIAGVPIVTAPVVGPSPAPPPVAAPPVAASAGPPAPPWDPTRTEFPRWVYDALPPEFGIRSWGYPSEANPWGITNVPPSDPDKRARLLSRIRALMPPASEVYQAESA